MRSRLAEARSRFRNFGFDAVLDALSWRMPPWLFHYSHSYLVWFDRLMTAEPNPEGFEIRLAQPTDENALAAFGVPPRVFSQRLEAGDICGLAIRPDKSIAAMLWTATGRFYLRECGVDLDAGPEGIYRYNAITHPADRRKGLYAACCSVVDRHYAALRRSCAYGVISRFNLVSQNVNQNLGMKIVGEVYRLTIFGVSVRRVNSWPQAVPGLRVYVREPAGMRAI